MATIHREVLLEAEPAKVWEALRDVGAPHERLVRGFVVDTRMDGGDRLVTFVNGRTVRERIVAVDDEHRRVVWAVLDGGAAYHHAAAQVLDHPGAAPGSSGSPICSPTRRPARSRG